MVTLHLLSLWEEGQTRFTGLLSKLYESDLTKTLAPSPNSIGFLIRQIFMRVK